MTCSILPTVTALAVMMKFIYFKAKTKLPRKLGVRKASSPQEHCKTTSHNLCNKMAQ